MITNLLRLRNGKIQIYVFPNWVPIFTNLEREMGTITRDEIIAFLENRLKAIGDVFHVKVKKYLSDGTPAYTLRYRQNGEIKEKYLGKNIPPDILAKLDNRKKIKELLKTLKRTKSAKRQHHRHLYLIGYQEYSINDFIKTLKSMHIKVLIDIRENPWSRRKEFRKNILNEILRKNGIIYIHIPALGNPKNIREYYKLHKDTLKMLTDYYLYLSISNLDIPSIFDELLSEPVVLMCYEKETTSCHRLALAIKLLLGGVIDGFTDIREEINKDQIFLFCENLSKC